MKTRFQLLVAINLMRTPIGLLAQTKSMRSIAPCWPRAGSSQAGSGAIPSWERLRAALAVLRRQAQETLALRRGPFRRSSRHSRLNLPWQPRGCLLAT